MFCLAKDYESRHAKICIAYGVIASVRTKRHASMITKNFKQLILILYFDRQSAA